MDFLFLLYVFERSEPGIFAKYFNDKKLTIEVSGSSSQVINGTMMMTKPEWAITPYTKSYDWCSNCGHTYDVHPWIAFSINKHTIKFNKYFVRCGCCYDGCCCEDGYYGCVYCCLYSWSLQISNDNKTWTDVHKVEKDYSMRQCNEKTYTLDKEYFAKYIRLIQNEPCPGDPPCVAINKLELYGDVAPIDGDADEDEFVSFHDDDDISIIGHISKNAKEAKNYN